MSDWKASVAVLAVVLVAILDASVQAVPVISIDATDRGFYYPSTSPHHHPENTSYLARWSSPGDPTRNFFVFDLSGVPAEILAAELRLYNPGADTDGHDGFVSVMPFETYSTYDVTTPIPTLLAPGFHVGGEIYDDLGSGIAYGSQTVTADINGAYVTVELNEDFISAANTTDGLIAVGGRISDGWIFGYTHEFPMSATQLLVTAVPEPSTVVLAASGALLLVVCCRRRIRRNRGGRASRSEGRRIMQAAVLLTLFAVPAGTAGTVGAVEFLYRVTDLGALPGWHMESQAKGLNELGQVVGVAESADGDRAFVWTEEEGMQVLGGLPEDTFRSSVQDINDLGQCVGSARNGETLAYLWDIHDLDSAQGLGTLYPSHHESGASDVNNSGQVVGGSSWGDKRRAFLWTSAEGMRDLGHIPGGEGRETRAYAINELGHVVGYNYLNFYDEHAFLWTPEEGMRDLGDFEGGADESYAYDINDHDQVVGYGTHTAGRYACLWQSDGSMVPLGKLPGDRVSGIARAINNHGQIVGDAPHDAFLWTEETGMLNLNDLLDESGAGWRLQKAYDINDAGQIVGSGDPPNSDTHAFLLTPIPEPSTLVLLSMGAGALLAGGWRRRRHG